MLLYVDSRPVAPDEGVNIGAGVLFLWLVVSVVLLVLALVVELVRYSRAPRFVDE
jgi:beta-lactamase regulating signal transducer with metallopeptidase domain